jgi:hypothetical protein
MVAKKNPAKKPPVQQVVAPKNDIKCTVTRELTEIDGEVENDTVCFEFYENDSDGLITVNVEKGTVVDVNDCINSQSVKEYVEVLEAVVKKLKSYYKL